MSLNVLIINPGRSQNGKHFDPFSTVVSKKLTLTNLNYSIKLEQNMHSCCSFQGCAVFDQFLFLSKLNCSYSSMIILTIGMSSLQIVTVQLHVHKVCWPPKQTTIWNFSLYCNQDFLLCPSFNKNGHVLALPYIDQAVVYISLIHFCTFVDLDCMSGLNVG